MHGYTDYMNTVMNKGIISTSYTYVNHSEINLALVEIQFSAGFSLLNDRDSNLGVPDKHWRKMWRCTFLWGSIHRARGSSKCKWMMIFWMWLKMGVTFDRRWFCGFSCGSISSSSLKIVKAWRLCFINKTRWEETSKFNQSCHHLLLQFYPCEARHSNLWTSAVKGHWAKLGQVSESPNVVLASDVSPRKCKTPEMLLVKKRTSKNQALAQKSQHIVAKIMEKELNGAKSSMIDLNTYTIHTHIFIYICIGVRILRKQLQPHTPPKHNLCGPSRLWRCGRPIVNDLRQFK